MSQSAPPDRRERDAARLRLEANVVVEAGAGTGKTALLTDRLLFLLLGGEGEGLSIGRVVALTFTEKAAGEIKIRLSQRLLDLLAFLEGEPLAGETLRQAEGLRNDLRTAFKKDDSTIAARARAAIEEIDQAQIGTIHAFAAHLLRLYPVEAGVDPGFSVDEGDFFDELFEREWALWLDTELGEEAPRRREWLEVLERAPLEDLEALARALCGERADLEGVGGPDEASAAWLEEAASTLSRAAKGQPKPKGNSKILESIEGLVGHLKKLADAARAENPPLAENRGAGGVKAAKWPAAWDQTHKVLYEEAHEAAARASAAGEALVRRACRLIQPFSRAFREGYARRGFVSFDGLLRRARDLVRDRPQARGELKSRYAAMLIDEFQDTDPLQGELLMFLAEEPGGAARRWQEVRLGAGRLFVVGDPKQSIYRFRGADIAAVQGFTQRLLADSRALACDLKANFRSPAELLGPVNAVFSSLMSYEPGLQPAYKGLEAAGPRCERPAGLELVSVGPPGRDGGEFDAEAVQRAEAAWISAWVVSNCGPGRKYAFKDAAVLLRSSTPLKPLLDELKSHDIPYAVEVEKYFYGAQEVIDFVNLLRVLEDPDDRLSLAGLLRSPLAGLEDAELYALARARALSYLQEPPLGVPAATRRRLDALYARLRGLRARVGRLALGDLVAAVLEETALVELCSRAYHGQQTASNLMKFARMAAAWSEGRGLTLREFIERVARDMKQSAGEGESPLADEHLDAVRLLTIHKAKGLEFPVVFLSNASGSRGGAGRRPVCLSDWASGRSGLRLVSAQAADASMARLEALEARREEREAVRLLYVAMTRAKERLFILGKDKGDSSAFTSILAAAGAWPGPDHEGDRLELPAGAGSLKVHRVGADFAAPRRTPRRDEDVAAALPSPERLAKIWRERLLRRDEAAARRWTASPTDYLKEPPKRVLFDEEEPPRGIKSSDGFAVGKVCHRVLEKWDFRGGGDLPAAVASACRLLSRSSPAVDWKAAATEALELLESFLASPAGQDLARVEILGRELPFIYEEKGAVMRGVMDLLYKNGEKLVVTDYKTDKVPARGVAARRREYERQGAAYRAAVEKALGVSGVEFRLLFLRHPETAG